MEKEVAVIKERKYLSVGEIRAQVGLIQSVLEGVMIKEVHYGIIPGCKNPSLYKAGSEKIMTTFKLTAEPIATDLSNDDEARYRVSVRLATHDGVFVGSGIGECSSNEDKYKWRKAVCDEEFNETPEDKRREKWKDYKGKTYKVKQVRTNPADLANTVLKMAKKRAQVDAVLTVTGASDIFEQDIEDLPEEILNEGRERQNADRPKLTEPREKKEPAKEVKNKLTPSSVDPEFTTAVNEAFNNNSPDTPIPLSQLNCKEGDTVTIQARIKSVYPAKGKAPTAFLVEDGDKTEYIKTFNTDLEGMDPGVEVYFILCKVSSYNNKLQYLADDVQICQ